MAAAKVVVRTSDFPFIPHNTIPAAPPIISHSFPPYNITKQPLPRTQSRPLLLPTAPVYPPKHWLYSSDTEFWTKCGTYPSQRFLDTISSYIYSQFSTYLNNLSTSDVQKRTAHFFYFVCGRTPMSRGTILHATILLSRLISFEREASTDNTNVREPIVTEANIGTLLLCALIIAGKINEDRPFNNKYWSNLLNIHINIVNSSEAVFLERIHYEVTFDSDRVIHLARSLNL